MVGLYSKLIFGGQSFTFVTAIERTASDDRGLAIKQKNDYSFEFSKSKRSKNSILKGKFCLRELSDIIGDFNKKSVVYVFHYGELVY